MIQATNGQSVHKLDHPYWRGAKGWHCVSDQNEDPASNIWHNGAKVSQIVANTCDEDELKKMVWSFGSVWVSLNGDPAKTDLSKVFINGTINPGIKCEYVL